MESKTTAIGKSINILQVLAEPPCAYSVMEISQKLSINRTTVHRILSEFQKVYLVVQTSDKKYTLGPGLFHIGAKYLYREKGFDRIKEIVEKVAIKVKQNIGYAVIDEGKIINLYEFELTMPIKITYAQGTIFPIHCGAYGKTIMAYYEPREALEKMVRETPLEQRTSQTITDPDCLLKAYEKIRKTGYGISDGENMSGAYGIGVPIFTSSGQIHGCLGLAMFKETLDYSQLDFYVRLLKKGAKEISKYVV